jgi:hypothetical protein
MEEENGVKKATLLNAIGSRVIIRMIRKMEKACSLGKVAMSMKAIM